MTVQYFFRDVRVGDTFEFAGEAEATRRWAEGGVGPCRKIGPRTYEDVRGHTHRVGSIRVGVVNVGDPVEAAREEGMREAIDALRCAEEWARGELSGVLSAPPRRFAESVLAAFARLRAPRSL